MPKFVSAHAIACMTRQDVSRLLKRFKEEENADVINIRVLCDTLSGRMVCEWEARGQYHLNRVVEKVQCPDTRNRVNGSWRSSMSPSTMNSSSLRDTILRYITPRNRCTT